MSPWTKNDVDRHKEGLTDRQKETWVEVANGALKSCLAKGKKQSDCEVSAIRQANSVVGVHAIQYYSIQVDIYPIRREVHQGRQHLIVPVIMMTEGVHSGSHGSLLHLEEDLARFPAAWNGIPVTVQHPENEGEYISANNPQIIDGQSIGRIYNTYFSDGKLRAEAWLDEEKLKQGFSAIYGYLNSQKPLEVSLGMFTDDEMSSGIWHDEQYAGIARNHRPDHLALLPGGTGACSWEDGCGIRANQRKQEGGDNGMDLIQTMKALIFDGLSVIQIDKQSYGEVITAIQTKLDRMDDDSKVHFLRDVFDNYFVYEIGWRGGDGSGLFKRGYRANDAGVVEFTGEPEPVVRKIEYTPTTMKRTNMKGGVTSMADEKRCCPEKINRLIQNVQTAFQEDDRSWLEILEESQVDKLLAMADMLKEDPPKDVVQMNKEQALQVLAEQLKDPQKFMELLPKETREQMSYGLKLHQERRAEMIKQITANTDVFTVDELGQKDVQELEKLAKAIVSHVDYSGFGGGRPPDAMGANIELLLPPGVKAA